MAKGLIRRVGPDESDKSDMLSEDGSVHDGRSVDGSEGDADGSDRSDDEMTRRSQMISGMMPTSMLISGLLRARDVGVVVTSSKHMETARLC